jgi:alpha-galactosidase
MTEQIAFRFPMQLRRILPALFVMLAGVAGLHAQQKSDTTWLSTLDLATIRQSWSTAKRNLSVDEHPLSIGGKIFANGIGSHSKSRWLLDLDRKGVRFLATVGADDEMKGSPRGLVEFQIFGDDSLLWKSPPLRAGDASVKVNISVTGVSLLGLRINDGGDGIDYDHANWCEARLVMPGAVPRPFLPPGEKAVILTPLPAPTPRINGASVYGARPQHPFLYRIPATGVRPMSFSAKGLPPGLTLNGSGIISGKATSRGMWRVQLTAKNSRGTATRELRIVIGDTIALTPPLGWNSWNCFAEDVDAAKVLGAAQALVRSGLADHGWSYINIDDCWMRKPAKDSSARIPTRDAQGRILSNEKFPNMKGLCDNVHALGLKIGTYTGPGALTCAGYTGAFGHEEADARRFAEWGFDYLKYDWCSYEQTAKDHSLPELQKPYRLMRAALDKAPRDIVYSLCQYGMGDVWKWGAEVGGNAWRTTGDITDSWESMEGIGFSQQGKEAFAGPGRWNDPDMLVVGLVGWGPTLHPTRLTPSEQYTHITLWSLLAAPLLIGCDLTKLDPFTTSLLSNDEVLEVNQDALGRQASRVAVTPNTEVWAKDMEDGSKAVGLFNRSEKPQQVRVLWKDLGLAGTLAVRDLWRQQDLRAQKDSFTMDVPPHGAALLRVRRAGK